MREGTASEFTSHADGVGAWRRHIAGWYGAVAPAVCAPLRGAPRLHTLPDALPPSAPTGRRGNNTPGHRTCYSFVASRAPQSTIRTGQVTAFSLLEAWEVALGRGVSVRGPRCAHLSHRRALCILCLRDLAVERGFRRTRFLHHHWAARASSSASRSCQLLV